MRSSVLLALFLTSGLAWGENPAPPQEAALQPIGTPSTAPAGIDGFTEFDQLSRLRDPFKRISVAKGPYVPKSPLELYPADSYKMVGVLTGPERLRAMLVDPDGKTHVVSERMKLGMREGWIFRILADRIVVREKFTNLFGQVENNDQEIKIEAEKRGSSSSSSATSGPRFHKEGGDSLGGVGKGG